ncbi:hypothetical protein J3458_021065 [Metarhizium acridum]|uniref:Uncharacterized protein n=1 Tax=Metarhizium acridum (strain CQMa 102) TaxID=655827 RepID=E9EAI7_METAQ|nr:uncharacterized protein MAC_06885 [Metarhizium acridum CQMa 102]EFY87096.1 hypothetical protein MAC_06885 [Metarhizium acridum CQMa 102]KAG8406733.1 hypothetical protein J3458_021065 [Metarhizium acridum]
MRKALLSSSEVSALVSIIVVILFTLALFLSGYALQQRTLQDLRVAIRPGHTKPSPKAHLPDYFKRETVRLQDGTVVVRESLADKDEKARIAKKYELHGDEDRAKTEQKQGDDARLAPEQRAHDEAQADGGTRRRATEEQLAMLETIKERAAGQAWGVDHPDPLAKNPLPVTRAERRKLIKDEIQRLAQAEKPVYYQRRLW